MLLRSNPWISPSFAEEFFRPVYEDRQRNRAPEVNIKESDTSFELEIAIPGKKKDDIAIELDHGVLTISSDNKFEKEENQNRSGFIRREFGYTSLKRSFSVPESVNGDEIKATYEHGVLSISLPKREEALPKPKKQIEIV